MVNKWKRAMALCSVDNTKFSFTDYRVLFKEEEETETERMEELCLNHPADQDQRTRPLGFIVNLNLNMN